MMTAGIAMIPAAAAIPPATLATMTGFGLLDVCAALAVGVTVALLVALARARATSRAGWLSITKPQLAA